MCFVESIGKLYCQNNVVDVSIMEMYTKSAVMGIDEIKQSNCTSKFKINPPLPDPRPFRTCAKFSSFIIVLKWHNDMQIICVSENEK